LLGGLTWRPPSGGKHTMRSLHEASQLADISKHYVLFQSAQAVVYGLYGQRFTEESGRLPKGAISAAHCFAALVGQKSPNAALILNVPSSNERREAKIYVVVLEDGVPTLDLLTTETEARNALGAEDRPIWSDNPYSYPTAQTIDFQWLAQGASKAARVLPVPLNPLPFIVLTGCVALLAIGAFWTLHLKEQKKARELAQAQANSDPVPKYLLALEAAAPQMATNRDQVIHMIEYMLSSAVYVPGWSVKHIQCNARINTCTTAWDRKGGTFNDLYQALPHDELMTLPESKAQPPLLDEVQTTHTVAVDRVNFLAPPQPPLSGFHTQSMAAAPLMQVWKTAGLLVDIKAPSLWPPFPGMPTHFAHPSAVQSGELSITAIPGPFIIETLQSAPSWVSWELIQADLNEGDMRSRLKFTAKGTYYAKNN
jgi:hypothetical protein